MIKYGNIESVYFSFNYEIFFSFNFILIYSIYLYSKISRSETFIIIKVL